VQRKAVLPIASRLAASNPSLSALRTAIAFHLTGPI
jgi:hypothetical protein